MENQIVSMNENKGKRSRFFIYLCIVLTLALFILALSSRVVVHKGEKYNKEEQIALYILTYDGKLPANFITKTQAQKKYNHLFYKKAWYKAIGEGYNLGGGPHDYSNSSDGYNSKISKYTSSTNLRECDVYTVSNAEIQKRESRGASRIVYTTGGTEVYCTTDHYQTFQRRTAWNINLVSNISWIIFGVVLFFEIAYLVSARIRGKTEKLHKVKEAVKEFSLFIFGLICLLFYSIYLLIGKIVLAVKEAVQSKCI